MRSSSGRKPWKKSNELAQRFGRCASLSASREWGRWRRTSLARSLKSQAVSATNTSSGKYSQLGITDRTSDNKPLGYQRLDRRGNRELKNLSYHAWRTACKSTTGPNPIKTFYQQSRLRTGSVRHARLNTQRKILEAMWLIWLRRRRFDPNKFTQTQPAPQGASCGGNQALEVRAIARQ